MQTAKIRQEIARGYTLALVDRTPLMALAGTTSDAVGSLLLAIPNLDDIGHGSDYCCTLLTPRVRYSGLTLERSPLDEWY